MGRKGLRPGDLWLWLLSNGAHYTWIPKERFLQQFLIPIAPKQEALLKGHVGACSLSVN